MKKVHDFTAGAELRFILTDGTRAFIVEGTMNREHRDFLC